MGRLSVGTWVVGCVVGLSGTAGAEQAIFCESSLESPFDGQTNVAPDARPLVGASCSDWLPVELRTAAGADVPFEASVVDGSTALVELVPLTPFTPGEEYVLSLRNRTRTGRCGAVLGASARFLVGGRPRLLEVDVDATNVSALGMTLEFSEELALDSLSADPPPITVTRTDGVPLSAAISLGGRRVVVSFRPTDPRPALGTEFRVAVSQALKFQSGATLDAPIDATTKLGFDRDGEFEPCATTSGGCACGGLGAGALALAGLFGRRRARGWPSAKGGRSCAGVDRTAGTSRGACGSQGGEN